MMYLSLKNVAVANIRNRKLFSIILVSFVFILSCAVFMSCYLVLSLKNGLSSLKDRLGADVIIVPEGIEKKIEGAILQGSPESFYMDKSVISSIPKEVLGNIESMSFQLYIATLTLGCCSFPLQAIGVDFETDFVVRPWMTKEVELPLKKDEIVIGYNIMASEGETLRFFGHDYKVKTKLGLTGIGFDNSVFLSIQDAREMAHRARKLTSIPSCEDDALISNVLIKVKDARPRDISIKLNKVLRDQGATSFVAANMMSDISSKLRGLVLYIYVLLVVTGVLGLAAIVLTIFVNIAQRHSEYASLRTIGATKTYILQLAMLEMDILSFLGAMLGTSFALIISILFGNALKLGLQLPFLSPQLLFLLLLFFIIVFSSIVLVNISSFLITKIITRKEIAIRDF